MRVIQLSEVTLTIKRSSLPVSCCSFAISGRLRAHLSECVDHLVDSRGATELSGQPLDHPILFNRCLVGFLGHPVSLSRLLLALGGLQ
jgi:hypothetical protein